MTETDCRKFPVIPVLSVICLLCLTLMGIALIRTSPSEPGAFVPPPFESKAAEGTPAVPEGTGWQELDAGAFRFSVCGRVTTEQNKADIWLTNPQGSPVWLKLRVLDSGGNILGETGLLRAGEYVRSVAFDTVPARGEHVVLKIMAYEPETYRSGGAVEVNTTAE